MPDVLFEKEGHKFMAFLLYNSENLHKSDKNLKEFIKIVKLAKDIEKVSEKLPIEFRVINLHENNNEERIDALKELFTINDIPKSVKFFVDKL